VPGQGGDRGGGQEAAGGGVDGDGGGGGQDGGEGVKLLPIWSTCILFWTVYSQMTTFSVEQATRISPP